MINNDLCKSIKVMYLINELVDLTEKYSTHRSFPHYDEETRKILDYDDILDEIESLYEVTVQKFEDVDEDDNDTKQLFENILKEFPEWESFEYLELHPVGATDDKNDLYIYCGEIWTNLSQLYDIIWQDIDEQLFFLVKDDKNILYKIHQVPANVEIKEPTHYGEFFQYEYIRNNVWNLLYEGGMDVVVTFEDDKTYIIKHWGEFLTTTTDFFEKMKLYEVPCSKAKKIVIDEFERECHVIFEKK